MKKSLSMLLVGSMLVTALAGCGGNTDTQGAGDGQDNTDAAATAFLIGGTAPLTGEAAIYGNAVKTAPSLRRRRSTRKAGIFRSRSFSRMMNTTRKRLSVRTTRSRTRASSFPSAR